MLKRICIGGLSIGIGAIALHFIVRSLASVSPATPKTPLTEASPSIDCSPQSIDIHVSGLRKYSRADMEALIACSDRAVPTLIGLLSDNNDLDNSDGVKGLASYALGQIPSEARATGLIIFFQSRNAISTVFWKSCENPNDAAMHNGDETTQLRLDAIPQLILALKNSDPRIRATAVKILGSLGTAAKATTPALETALQDTDDQVRSAATEALEAISWSLNDGGDAQTVENSSDQAVAGTDKEVADLISDLRSADSEVRRTAVFDLEDIGAAAAVPPLIKLLKGQDIVLKGMAAYALAEIGSPAKAAVLSLVVELQSPDLVLRDISTYALKEMGADAKAGVPMLISALSRPDAGIRVSAASVLGSIGSAAQTAVPALITRLSEDEDAEVREAAASALAHIGSAAQAAIPVLITRLSEDKDVRVRLAAVDALALVDSDAQAAVPALITRLSEDEDVRVRKAAALTLGRFGGAAKAAIPLLVTAFRDDASSSFSKALELIGADAVPFLLSEFRADNLRDDYTNNIINVMVATKANAIPALTIGLKDDNARVRLGAAQALSRMARSTRTDDFDYHLCLAYALQPEYCSKSSWEVKKILSSAKTTIPLLLIALQDQNQDVRLNAAAALGFFGSKYHPNMDNRPCVGAMGTQAMTNAIKQVLSRRK